MQSCNQCKKLKSLNPINIPVCIDCANKNKLKYVIYYIKYDNFNFLFTVIM